MKSPITRQPKSRQRNCWSLRVTFVAVVVVLLIVPSAVRLPVARAATLLGSRTFSCKNAATIMASQQQLRVIGGASSSSSDESDENTAATATSTEPGGITAPFVEESTQQQPQPVLRALPTVLETTTTTVLQDDDEESSTTQAEPNVHNMEQASVLRTKAKQLHDEGDFVEAASLFQQAAMLLVEPGNDSATCRLHEALCRLKANDGDGAIAACSAVLEWVEIEPALRARALHRRAKAYMLLQQTENALKDARAAAFLGDRKAVALYGTLMREKSGGDSMDNGYSGMAPNALLDLLSNKQSTSAGTSTTSSTTTTTTSFENPFSPASFLNMGSGKSSSTNLAKSVLTSLSKRLEDKATQDSICNFLAQVNGMQLQSMAGMAGLSLTEPQATRLANLCQGVTPKLLQRFVAWTKRGVYVFTIVRKTGKVMTKYRNVIVMIILLSWIKSSLLRPIPLSRAAKKAARQAAKAAAKAAANSSPI